MFATRGMHPCPLPCWYLYKRDAESVRLLTDEGEPSPELSEEPARTLAVLASVLHAKAYCERAGPANASADALST
jgi:hypothetical protein